MGSSSTSTTSRRTTPPRSRPARGSSRDSRRTRFIEASTGSRTSKAIAGCSRPAHAELDLVGAVGRALSISFAMTWEILWALMLGFTLSAVVQAVVPKERISRLLPDDSPRTLAVASLLGAASSSCSYAAVALARSLFQKGADFTAAMAFEIASTNLVVELGIIMALLLGWEFVVGEFVGGPLMIVLLALLFRLFLKPRPVEAARAGAERGRRGSMEGHAAMDMAVSKQGSIVRRAVTP